MNDILDANTVPTTLAEGLTAKLYTRLCKVAAKIASVTFVNCPMMVRDSDRTATRDELVNTHFCLRYAHYVQKFDATKGKTFEDFCVIEFYYIVGRTYFKARTASHKQGGVSVGQATEDYSGSVVEPVDKVTPVDVALEAEDLGLAAERLALIKDNLPKLTPDQSYILWNHSRGHSLDSIAISMGLSRHSVSNIHRGALSAMRRLLNEET